MTSISNTKYFSIGSILIIFLALIIPATSGAEPTENKELLNCLCRCLEPPGGQFSCSYDTEDKGWSPSCRDLSNGPCICKAYGCFRGNLPTEGECYNKCYERLKPETAQTPVEPETTQTLARPEISSTPAEEIDGDKAPQRFLNPEQLEKLLDRLGYEECDPEGDLSPGSIILFSRGGKGIAHSSVVLPGNRQIEMGHKRAGTKIISEILTPGENPEPNKGTYIRVKAYCPPAGKSFDSTRVLDCARNMEGIDREFGKPTQWNCHGFSGNMAYRCFETGLRVKSDTEFNWDQSTLQLKKGTLFGKTPLTVEIPQGQVLTHSQYTIEVKEDKTTTLLVIEGNADYQGAQHSLSISSGQMAVIGQEGIPSDPVAFDVNKMYKWWEDPESWSEAEYFTGLTFESRSKPGGSIVQIPLTLSGTDEKIGNIDITLGYDPSVIDAMEAIKGGLTDNSLFDRNIKDGTIKISLADKEGFSGDGSIAYIEFDVIGNEGSTSLLEIISLSLNKAEDMEPMFISTNDGFFTVLGEEEGKGDCNGDGMRTSFDALCVLQMSVGKKPEDMVMDVNGDKKVSSLDARKILKIAVGSENK